MGVTQLEDWYRVRPNDALKHEFGPVIRIQYNWSLAEALLTCYPEHEWHAWRFLKTPQAFWTSPTNRRSYFEWLQSKLGVKTMSDWYQVQKAEIVKNHGNGLLTHYYSQSPTRAIMDAFPEHKWQPWKFDRVPLGFWNEISHRKQFFDHLAESKGFTKLEDWYLIDVSDFAEAGGSSIASAFNNRVVDIVMTTFPEHNWQPWRFRRGQGLRNPEGHRKFMDWLYQELKLKSLADWYDLSSLVIKAHGGSSKSIQNLFLTFSTHLFE